MASWLPDGVRKPAAVVLKTNKNAQKK